jgi:RNA polymerase sigma-70 factor (ECF subfamily)
MLGELADVYRLGYGDFVRVAQAITGEEQAAIDAVHDAFVSAVRRRADFRGRAAVKTWVWRIVVNSAQRKRKRRSAVVATDPDTLNALVEANGNGAVTSDRAALALLASLPERQRLVLFLRHYADLAYDEIAEVVEVAPGTVAATLHAARANVRAQLELEEERCPH